MSTLLDAALAYAARGWPVFPCEPSGKQPLTEHGFKDATCDSDQIRVWWADWPEANIGLPTGVITGMVVLDLDPRHGGNETLLAELARQIPELAHAPRARSGGGGLHLLLAHPGEPVKNAAGIRPGLDVRGDGGYIIAAPSVHESGNRYEWLTPLDGIPLPAFPVELMRRWRALSGKPRPSWAEKALEREVVRVAEAPRGQRNHQLNTSGFNLGQIVAGTYLERVSVEEALLGAAITNGLVEDDGEEAARATIRSGLDAGEQKPRGPKGRARPESRNASSPAPEPGGEGARTVIVVRDELAPLVDEAEAALLSDPSASIYTRGRMLVRVVRDTGTTHAGLIREAGSPIIQQLPLDALREAMDRAAEWIRCDRRTGEPFPALPPEWVARTLAARSMWKFPRLEAVIETPTMRPDGTLLTAPGYDPTSGLLLTPSEDYPLVRAVPSRDDAARAAALLEEPFVDFPFLGASDRATAVAAILTLLARHAIRGPVPMFAWRATTPGSGKGLGCDVVCLVGTGRVAPRMSLPREDNELRKTILAVAIEGTPAVLLDNVDGALGSHSLAAALTADEWEDRVLGASRRVRAPLRAVWLASGNNLVFRGDLGRRVLPIDLDPRLEHPEDRTGFKYPDLLASVRERRAQLVIAGLTLLWAYQVAGRPGHGRSPKGSFEAWDALVRGACIWIGLGDPCAGSERIRADGDSDLGALGAAMDAWATYFGDTPTTAATAVRRALDLADGKDPALRDALLGLTRRDRLDARSLGYGLRGVRGRIVRGRHFTNEGPGEAGAAWRLADTSTDDDDDDDGFNRERERDRVSPPHQPSFGLEVSRAGVGNIVSIASSSAELLSAHDWEPAPGVEFPVDPEDEESPSSPTSAASPMIVNAQRTSEVVA